MAGRPVVRIHGQKTSNPSKRRSLPQYCAKPECVQTRSPPLVPAINITTAQRKASENRSHVNALPRHEGGWNARRERARLEAEQALSGVNLRPTPSSSTLQRRNSSALPEVSLSPRPKSSQPHLRSYYSQRHSLRNSRSMTSTPSRSEQSSVGSSSRDTALRDRDVDSSERTSTDSSSFRSSRESAIRRSRSSSSSQSFTLQGVPALPSGCAQPTNAYYSALHSHYHNGYPYQLPGPMYVQAPSEIRASSMPFRRLDNVNAIPRNSYTNASPAMRSNPPHGQYNNTHRPRPRSLSAQTTSGHQQSLQKQPSQPSIKPDRRRTSTQQNPQPSSLPSTSLPNQRHRSNSSLKVPQKAHLPHRTQSATLDPPRAIPNREALTKWKSEREEGKAELDGMQRARVKERVKRANEMEREKERELQKLGKGAEKGLEKEEDKGCFGGLFGRVLGRWR